MPLKWFFFINFIRILWFIWDLVLVLFNSHKDITSGKILAFGNILGFPGINWAQKWTKTLRPVSPETLNFERLFKFYFCLVRDYLRSKFHQTCAIFRGERAQNPPPPSPPPQPKKKGGFMDAASPRKHLNVYNLTVTNAKTNETYHKYVTA